MDKVKTARARRYGLRKLGEQLLTEGLLSDDQLREALEFQKKNGGYIGETLVEMGYVDAGQIKPYLEGSTGFPFVDILEEELDMPTIRAFSEDLVKSRGCLPYKSDESNVYLAMADPLNLGIIDEFQASTDKKIVPCMALTNELSTVIRRVYDVRYQSQSVLDEIEGEEEERGLDLVKDLADDASQAPIVRLVNTIISGAISAGASDIHIEPQEGTVRVRYRIDGLMYDQMTFPRSHHASCLSRLKILATLDISERRRPQDGQFTLEPEPGRRFDARLSIMPTIYGEKACIRLLEKASSLAHMDNLGMYPDQREAFESFIAKAHGLVLVTGPTGSGKSTTLYAGLTSINDAAKNINTIEDPVEYKLPGVNQVQVNAKIGLTFASGLRTLVRQDPDVILVGEIRDGETAEMAVQAALTGHLVLSTLHTNDAPGALVRLANMGIEPFLTSSTVVGIVAQRLARLSCPHCRELYELTQEEADAMGMELSPDQAPPTVARSRGCKRCGGRGARGRTAIMEVLTMTDKMRRLALQGVTGQEMMQAAIEEGFRPMRQTAISKVLELLISPEELIRVFSDVE